MLYWDIGPQPLMQFLPRNMIPGSKGYVEKLVTVEELGNPQLRSANCDSLTVVPQMHDFKPFAHRKLTAFVLNHR